MLSQHWWVIALRGLFAILFGVLAFMLPGLTFRVLVLFFGAFALVDGIWAVVHGISQKWLTLLFEGLIGIAAGVFTFFLPGITGFALIYIIAFWAVITGVLEIGTAIRLRKTIKGEWLMALGGIISIIFGIIVATYPRAGALAVIWIIGVYAIVFGILFMILAFRYRRHTNQTVANGTAQDVQS
jgi:uncharacterized membrane protein HdeD (DUF308 family)